LTALVELHNKPFNELPFAVRQGLRTDAHYYNDISQEYHEAYFRTLFAVSGSLRNRQLVTRRALNGRRLLRGVPETLAEQSYRLLKDQIISARYLPGQFLQEAQICGALGIGRTPIRQALQQLHQEGLVDVIHRKGVVVRSDSLAEILLALETRILVEPYCAAKCAESASVADVAKLHAMHLEYLEHRRGGDRHRLMDIDRKIHALIGSSAGNHLLLELLRPIQERMSRLWFLPHWQLNDFGETADEHDALVNAICSHQGDAASAAMKNHLVSLKQRIVSGQGMANPSV
jgi:GntR family transcriptional regulator, rspAB operon transcriptional repressor